MKAVVIILFAFTASLTSVPVFANDTQGKVSKVSLLPYRDDGRGHRLRIYFASVENDRWGCLAQHGYIEVSDASPYVTLDQFKMILSMAMSAQASGASFAIDSPSVDSCTQGNMASILLD